MSDQKTKIENLVLDDGRRAERHTTLDEAGNEIVEIFAEEKRPLKLEKRITRETKNIIAKEVHETIRDGEIAFQEVLSLEPDVPLQVRSRVGLADHHKIVDGDYVRKDEIQQLITDGVVAGVSALMEKVEPVVETQSVSATPVFRAQAMIEKNLIENKKYDWATIGIVVFVIAAQIAAIVYYMS